MSSTVQAVRAVTSEYAKQLLRPLLFIGVGSYAVVMAIIGWIAYAASPWWLLLAFIPTLLFCVGLAIWIGVRVTASRIAPDMNRQQKTATRKVVKLVGSVAEQLGTPRFILIFRIIKDVVFPPSSKQTLIGELAETPGQLHRSFNELRKLF
jgi:hypothetical protein